jgi:hypothetical protein
MYGQSYLALGCANESRDRSRASESNMSTGIVKGEGTSVLCKIVVPCPDHQLTQIHSSLFGEATYFIFFVCWMRRVSIVAWFSDPLPPSLT